MDANVFYETQARELIKRIRREKGIPYWKLAQKLRELGEEVEVQPLINRVNRGTYNFEFALKLLAAMGVDTLEVPQLPRKSRQTRTS